MATCNSDDLSYLRFFYHIPGHIPDIQVSLYISELIKKKKEGSINSFTATCMERVICLSFRSK